MIEVNYIPNLPQLEFRSGLYEGICMHSTAVFGDCALGERNYECTHYPDAFVHAFSDPHSTIETANPNYLAYGAGPVANLRFLHSELCQVTNDGSDKAKADFKASYDNWIYYAAQRLFDRRLGVTPATPDGKGTVWQHYDVTKYLGGSTHVDPMDYLQTWDVTWDQVIADIQAKYRELEQMDELLKRVAALEYQQIKVPAPQWFVDEFKSADLGGLIKDPNKLEAQWEDIATVLRAVKYTV